MATGGRDEFLQDLIDLAKAKDSDVVTLHESLSKLSAQAVAPQTIVAACDHAMPGIGASISRFLVLAQEAPDRNKLVDRLAQLAGALPNVGGQILDRLKMRLEGLLALDIAGGFEAFALSAEYEKLFNSSAIFTDVRPIFSDGDSSKILSYFIIHQLKLKYDQLGTAEEVYLAVTTGELEGLAKQISLAIKHARSLKLQLHDVLGQERVLDDPDST